VEKFSNVEVEEVEGSNGLRDQMTPFGVGIGVDYRVQSVAREGHTILPARRLSAEAIKIYDLTQVWGGTNIAQQVRKIELRTSDRNPIPRSGGLSI
jgi:hypothetical protein